MEIRKFTGTLPARTGGPGKPLSKNTLDIMAALRTGEQTEVLPAAGKGLTSLAQTVRNAGERVKDEGIKTRLRILESSVVFWGERSEPEAATEAPKPAAPKKRASAKKS